MAAIKRNRLADLMIVYSSNDAKHPAGPEIWGIPQLMRQASTA
jgi:hypothetical protein